MRPHVQAPSLKRFPVHRDLAILVVVTAACALPFLGFPFHMDDNFYMDMARNAQVKPLYPNDTPYVFEGRSLPDMGSHSHPPLQTYFLALVQRFFGEGEGKEWIYHTGALVYPILALLAFYFLAARFVERPLWPSVVLACSPLFLVMQHTLMTDLPTLAFWLAAVACFLWAAERRSVSLYTSSAFFQFAAMFTSYQSIALTPLLAFYHLRKRTGERGWLFLLPAPLLMASWFVMNYLHYHRWLLVDTMGFVRSRHAGTLAAYWTKILAALEYQGWLILFPFFFLCVFARGLRGRLLAGATLLAVYLAQFQVPNYRLVDKTIFVVGLVTGIFIASRMGRLLLDSLPRRENPLGMAPEDAQFLGLWYFGVIAYCVLVFTEGSARYVLPLLPPVLICYFRQLEVIEVTEYRRSSRPILGSAMLASGSLVLTLAWGLALSHADLEFARIYPRAARDFSRVTGGMTSYFAGEWGFRYYFSRAGARQLPTDESMVRGGSYLARPRLALPYEIPADLREMTMPVQSLTYEPSTPLRILDKQTPAGFYSTGWGLIPFSISRGVLESVDIRQVNYLVEQLPYSRVETTSSVKPWPGLLGLHDLTYLSVLARPETSLLYPWRESDPLVLRLFCGVAADAYAMGSEATFQFIIRQRDSVGRVLVESSKMLKPGIREEDRGWLPLRLQLLGRKQGAESLELIYRGGEGNGTGAFAEAFLQRGE